MAGGFPPTSRKNGIPPPPPAAAVPLPLTREAWGERKRRESVERNLPVDGLPQSALRADSSLREGASMKRKRRATKWRGDSPPTSRKNGIPPPPPAAAVPLPLTREAWGERKRREPVERNLPVDELPQSALWADSSLREGASMKRKRSDQHEF